MLPNLKHLDISDNKINLSGFMSLFDFSCDWNQLLSLNVQDSLARASFVSSITTRRDKGTMDYLNKVVAQGGLSSLQDITVNWYENNNTVWSKLERICLKSCDDQSLQKIASVRTNYLPALHTLCIVEYGVYDANNIRKLSEMGVYCHEFCAPWDDPFYPGKCRCQGNVTSEDKMTFDAQEAQDPRGRFAVQGCKYPEKEAHKPHV